MDRSFPPPYTPDFDRRQSAVRKASMSGEKVPEEEDGEMHAGEEKYHQVSLPYGAGLDRREENHRNVRKSDVWRSTLAAHPGVTCS